MTAPTEPAPRLTVRVTVNPVDPAASRAAAREDRMYDADLYDHDEDRED